MIDIEKIVIPASCRISALIAYLVQAKIIKTKDYIEVCSLITQCFTDIIDDYNEKEKENEHK